MTASDAELLERLKLKEPRKQTDQLRKNGVAKVTVQCVLWKVTGKAMA